MNSGGSLRVHRKVLSKDTGNWLLCCYRDCEKQGYDLYRAQVNDAAPGYPPKIVKFVFCSEGHRQLWVDASRGGIDGHYASGNHSTGRYL